MKSWQDCQWLRAPCGQKNCPLCGPIEEKRQEHIEKGEDPDSMEAALQDVSDNFQELMRVIKKDAAKHGIVLDDLEEEETVEPPPAEIYPLYNEVEKWSSGITKIYEISDEVSSAWLYTEAGEDLVWYARTLLVKTRRQLGNFWHIEQGEEYMDMECQYTGYVLNEVICILQNALINLIAAGGPHANKFNLALLTLGGIEEKMKKIKSQ